MDFFYIFLIALIGIDALIGIMVAIKLVHFLMRNKDKTIYEVRGELTTRLTHLFLMVAYFVVLSLVYLMAAVFMK